MGAPAVMDTCQDPELERALLSQLIRGPRSAMRLGSLTSDDVSVTEHRAVLEAALAIRAAGKVPWPETLRPAIASAQGWSQDRVARLFQDLSKQTPVKSVPAAVERLMELAHLRRVRTAALEVAAATERGSLPEARAAVVGLQTAAAAASEAPIRIQTAAEAVADGWESLARIVDHSGDGPKDSTGIEALDATVGTLCAGDQFVIGGYTGTGKSSLALCMALGAQDRRPGIVSCEDSPTTWGKRILAHHTAPPTNPADVVKSREMTANQATAFLSAAEAVAECPLHIAYAVKRPVVDVLDAMRRLVKEQGCGYLVVDYIQAIRFELGGGVRYDKAVADGAKRIKALAADLDVPVLLLSQLRRPERERRGGAQSEPGVGDLKETGDLENESEVVLLLWRPGRGRPTRCRVAKSKNTAGGELFDVVRGSAGVVPGLSAPLLEDEPRAFSAQKGGGW